jgi:hypothetical protein
MAKSFQEKNQTQLWNHLYKASMFASGSLPYSSEHQKEIKQKFQELQEYLESVILSVEEAA